MDEETRARVIALVPAVLAAMTVERWRMIEGWCPSGRGTDPVGTWERRLDGKRITMSAIDLIAEYQRERDAAVVREAARLVRLTYEPEFWDVPAGAPADEPEQAAALERVVLGVQRVLDLTTALVRRKGCAHLYLTASGERRCSMQPTGYSAGPTSRCSECPRRPL